VSRLVLIETPRPNGSGRRRPPGRITTQVRLHRASCRFAQGSRRGIEVTQAELDSNRHLIYHCKVCKPGEEEQMTAATQGTPEQVAANALSNMALAGKLDTIALSPRAMSREQRDAVLTEAAKRLRWPDNYAAHKAL
jgi:hypothetical protein